MQLKLDSSKKNSIYNFLCAPAFEHSTLEKYANRIDQIKGKGGQLLSLLEPFVAWRDKESILYPSINSKGCMPVAKTQYTHPKKIFLTGATGFVGAFFLKELIENTEAKIYSSMSG